MTTRILLVEEWDRLVGTELEPATEWTTDMTGLLITLASAITMQRGWNAEGMAHARSTVPILVAL